MLKYFCRGASIFLRTSWFAWFSLVSGDRSILSKLLLIVLLLCPWGKSVEDQTDVSDDG